MNLKKYVTANLTFKINYKFIPVNILVDSEEWNQIYRWLYNNTEYFKIQRTPSGGIAIGRDKLRFPSWDLKLSKSCGELTILGEGVMTRLQFRPSIEEESNEKKIYGNQAFKEFKNKCEEYGIHLADYYSSVEEGKKAKSEIEMPIIKLSEDRVRNYTFNNVHHVDYHSSYPAGLVNTHPEFNPVIKYFFDRRKRRKINKAVLNYTIGYMQSSNVNFRLSHLSRDAINDNNKRIRKLAKDIEASGERYILAYNTDGIWYTGPIYHGPGEGADLGQWSNDHINCVWRAKSAGAYEFICDNKYKPVVRGKTNLDWIKPRSEWIWGDIYHCSQVIVKYTFVEGTGFIPINAEEEEI